MGSEIVEDHKIGVFICGCGGNISDTVKIEAVSEEVSTWDDVVISRTETYLCSKPSVEEIKRLVEKNCLERIIIASCTPRMHKKMFERSLDEVGIKAPYIEIVNIREQCSWIHQDDSQNATEKTIDLIRGAVAKVKEAVPLKPIKIDVKDAVMVIGGGIAGITASLRTAEHGYKTYLIEKNPSIGGHMIKYPKVFPTLDCSQCILTPKMGEISDNPNINLITLSEVKKVSGGPGDFHVNVTLKPRGIDSDKCIACGLCNQICPVEVKSQHDEGLGKRKAVHIPFPQAVPTVYSIDFENCTRCGLCEEKCPRGAVILDEKERDIELNVGTIILATGFDLYDISKLAEYQYGRHPNILTSIQMERMLDITGPTNSSVIRLSDGKPAKSVAFILCAGSRDINKGVPYCSRICCLYAIKQALILKKFMDIKDIWIHYIDIRAPGRRYEEFYKNAQMEGVKFVKGKVSEIIPEGDQLMILSEDMLANRLLETRVDIAVLCPPVTNSPETLKLAEKLKTPVDEDTFVLEKHPKLDPIATKQEGIYACGMVSGPKDIQSTVAESEGAAMKAINFIRTKFEIKPEKAHIKDVSICTGCGVCINICPFNAIELLDEKAKINQIACVGCGACIPSCHVDVIDLQGYTEDQLSSQIKAMLTDSKMRRKILAFLETETAYVAADIAGISRLSYPTSIRILPIPSTSRLKLRHILYAFAHGADGVMLLEAPDEVGALGKAHAIAEERAEDYMVCLEDYEIDSFRLWFSKIYVPDWRKLSIIFSNFDDMIKDEEPIDTKTRHKLLSFLNSE